MGWDMQMITKSIKLYEGLFRITKPIRDQTEAHEESAGANLARCVNKEFKRRIAKVIDPHSPDFDPIYVVFTILGPNNACLVYGGLKEVAETALLSMARVEDENANSLYIADAPAELLDHPMMLEQTAKFGEYAKANAVGSDSLKSAIAAYVASMFYELLHSAINPIAYWETEKRLSFLIRVIERFRPVKCGCSSQGDLNYLEVEVSEQVGVVLNTTKKLTTKFTSFRYIVL
ncbi:unnamed protein product [Toxocara canis]|uniref:Ras-GAP domain-containing protein n=1 Tax=Toxocara canis TaxID=6265 RepID=A0A183U3E9_TOXCA|nr:unnamed protein product [Toxocara canis]